MNAGRRNTGNGDVSATGKRRDLKCRGETCFALRLH